MTLTQAKDLGQIVAWFAAALFFLYKIISGYLIGSTSLRVSCVRGRVESKSETDYLSLVATVKRGSGSTLVLLHARARVTYAGGQKLPDLRVLPEGAVVPAVAETEVDLVGTRRLSSRRTATRTEVRFGELSSESPHLNLAPGDEMQFAYLYEVDQSRPCVVEVAVLGKSWGTWKRSQWRASDISLPIIAKP